jgi:hypothetical protein
MLSAAILAFDSPLSAVRSWLYFTGVGGRCASVDGILAGAPRFQSVHP